MEQLKIAFLSDIHLTESPFRIAFFRQALKNIRKPKNGYGVFVSVGDTTDHGFKEHWLAAQQCMEDLRPAPDCVLALGNHDTWNRHADGESEYEASLPFYRDLRRRICGCTEEAPYYSTVLHGVPFIMLSTEDSRVDGYVTADQIAWLRAELDKAAALHTFIFVISHWGLKGTHGLPATFGDKKYNEYTGSIGERSDEIAALFKQYPNTVYVSGHSHMGWIAADQNRGYASLERDGGLTLINLPCYMFANHDGVRNEPGLGLEVTVEGDRLTVCPKNYAMNFLLKRYKTVIERV